MTSKQAKKKIYKVYVFILSCIFPLIKGLAILEALYRFRTGYHTPNQTVGYPKNGRYFEIRFQCWRGVYKPPVRWWFGDVSQWFCFKTGQKVPHGNLIAKIVKKIKLCQ